MSDTNTITIQGRFVRDPELKYTNGGKATIDFGLASTRVWHDSDTREKKEEVTYCEVRAWGVMAESIAQYFHKGKPIIITGTLAQDRWEDKVTGKPRSKTLIRANSFSFSGAGPRDRANAQQAATPDEQGEPQREQQRESLRPPVQHQQFKPYRHPNAAPLVDSDEIPFD